MSKKENNDMSAVIAMLQGIQSGMNSLTERMDKIEAEAKKTPAQREQEKEQIRHDASRNTVPKAVKVVQYITHPDGFVEHKIPGRTFKNKAEADRYIQPLIAQGKTFNVFYI